MECNTHIDACFAAGAVAACVALPADSALTADAAHVGDDASSADDPTTREPRLSLLARSFSPPLAMQRGAAASRLNGAAVSAPPASSSMPPEKLDEDDLTRLGELLSFYRDKHAVQRGERATRGEGASRATVFCRLDSFPEHKKVRMLLYTQLRRGSRLGASGSPSRLCLGP